MPDENDFFRKKPQQSRSRSVVNALLQAADQLLERTGDPQKVSLQGIAQRAGVGIGSLYDYFSNRENLLGAFLARLTDANFAQLEEKVVGSKSLPFDQAIPMMVDETLKLYLDKPDRTRATIQTIVRLGWMKPIIVERDRFAGVLRDRLRHEYPFLPEDETQLMTEVMCDALMGVVVTELWRDQTPDRAERVKAELISIIQERIARLLAAHQKERPTPKP